MLPIITGNPLASLINNNRAVSQVNLAKHLNHGFAELAHRAKSYGLAHIEVLINKITENFIYKHVNS
jgi:hypothetical protein